MNSSPADIKRISEIIENHFNIDELHDLCFLLQIDYDALGGIGKRGKIRELIMYCERHERLPELVKAVSARRPNVDLSLTRDSVPTASLPQSSKESFDAYDLAALRARLDEAFDESELRNLCWELRINYEELLGSYKSDKVRELIAYCQRRGRLQDLQIISALKRPQIDWYRTTPQTSSVESQPEQLQVNLEQLYRVIARVFSTEDIKTLCFDLAIDYEALEGIGKSGKVAELVKYCERQSRISQLVNKCMEFRPDIDWDRFRIQLNDEPPFKGLHYYEEADAYLFFGREKLVERLTERVIVKDSTLPRSNFLAIVGASGSGKSSLVRAGLIPAVRQQTNWDVFVITPTAHPLRVLATSLASGVESIIATATFIDDLRQDVRSLSLYIRRLVDRGDKSENHRLLLVVDQFEGLFTLCRDESERQSFVDNLMHAVSDEEKCPITVIITLRADFYHQCAGYSLLSQMLEVNQVLIDPMSKVELQQAIVEPLASGGWQIEAGLVDLILADAGEGGNVLPLLSHALLETWQRRRGRMLTHSGYNAAGGIRGAIVQTAEALYQSLSSERQAAARSIFLRLVEIGEGASDTRRRVPLSELLFGEDEDVLTQYILSILVDARLIVIDRESVQVVHEALIREWPRLQQWIDEEREGLHMHRQLSRDAQMWEASGRDPSYLYRGLRLDQAQERLLSTYSLSLNQLETQFLQASLSYQEEENKQRRISFEQRLASRNRAERVEAVTELASLNVSFALPFLLTALENNQPPSRVRQIFSGRQREERAEMRQAIARAFGQIGDEAALDALDQLVQDPELEVRLAAVGALRNIGESAVKSLMVALGDEATDVRHGAVLALEAIGNKEAVPALQTALADVDAKVRLTAVQALSKIDGRQCVPALFRVLQDDDLSVQRAVYESLINFGYGEAINPNFRYDAVVLEVIGRSEEIKSYLRSTIRLRRPQQSSDLPPQEINLQLLIRAITLCNNAFVLGSSARGRTTILGNGVDSALLEAAVRLGYDKAQLEEDCPRIEALSSVSGEQLDVTVHQNRLTPQQRNALPWQRTTHIAFAKGDLDEVLTVSTQIWDGYTVVPYDEAMQQRVMLAHDRLAEEGQRVLGVGFQPLKERPERVESLNFIGLVGLIAYPTSIRTRLSQPVQQALLLAEGIRQRVGTKTILPEYMLGALCHKEDGYTYRLLSAFASKDRLFSELYRLIADKTGTLIEISTILPVRFPSALANAPLSDNVRQALDYAANLSKENGQEMIAERYLLAGLLTVQIKGVSQWLTAFLRTEPETFLRVIHTNLTTDEPPIAAIRDIQWPLPQTYNLVIQADAERLTVGERIKIGVALALDTEGRGAIEFPADIEEITCFLTADGLLVLSREVVVMPFGSRLAAPTAQFEVQAHLPGQRSLTVELFAEDASRGQIQIFRGEQQIEVVAPARPVEADPLLPKINVRFAPQPDLMLHIESQWARGVVAPLPQRLTYYLNARLPVMRLYQEPVGYVELEAGSLQRWQAMLLAALQDGRHGDAEQQRERLLSYGTYLFDQLFPEATAGQFRELFGQVQTQVKTWLISSDMPLWLPWELLVGRQADGRSTGQFWGERYQLSHWIEGLGRPLRHEVPLGEVALSHYKFPNERDGVVAGEAVTSWGRLLQATSDYGLGAVAEAETPYYGVHILRETVETLTAGEIQVYNEATGDRLPAGPEEEVPKVRLDLWRKRPLLTLSLIDEAGVAI
ncbi:MAG: HEAT repeat domain-containing protein, partial [Anaerolineales bacterium]|nr:HEAT repeat domain-containing protein [Anaerolineales bacterium]